MCQTAIFHFSPPNKPDRNIVFCICICNLYILGDHIISFSSSFFPSYLPYASVSVKFSVLSVLRLKQPLDFMVELVVSPFP